MGPHLAKYIFSYSARLKENERSGIQRCFSRLMEAEAVNSHWLQQAGSGWFDLSGSSQVGKRSAVSLVLWLQVLWVLSKQTNWLPNPLPDVAELEISLLPRFPLGSQWGNLSRSPSCVWPLPTPGLSLALCITVRRTLQAQPFCGRKWIAVRSGVRFKHACLEGRATVAQGCEGGTDTLSGLGPC